MIMDLTGNIPAAQSNEVSDTEKNWQIPAELPYVLYGNASQATWDAMKLLTKHEISYQLSMYHTEMHIPALDTSEGLIRGMKNIRRFAAQWNREVE